MCMLNWALALRIQFHRIRGKSSSTHSPAKLSSVKCITLIHEPCVVCFTELTTIMARRLARSQQLLLGAGEDDRVRSCCVHLEDNPSEAHMLCGR